MFDLLDALKDNLEKSSYHIDYCECDDEPFGTFYTIEFTKNAIAFSLTFFEYMGETSYKVKEDVVSQEFKDEFQIIKETIVSLGFSITKYGLILDNNSMILRFSKDQQYYDLELKKIV